jgi:hypothetical protein
MTPPLDRLWKAPVRPGLSFTLCVSAGDKCGVGESAMTGRRADRGKSRPIAPHAWRVGALTHSVPCLICAYANGDCLSVGMVTRSAAASISLATCW